MVLQKFKQVKCFVKRTDEKLHISGGSVLDPVRTGTTVISSQYRFHCKILLKSMQVFGCYWSHTLTNKRFFFLSS